MEIIPGCAAHCDAITNIYNHAVLHTDAIWNEKTVDSANRQAWLDARAASGYPVLVAIINGAVAGYASYGDWRAFEGFRYTVEHSVYVHPDYQGQGVGRTLLEALIVRARAAGKHVMVAGIESANAASLALHQRLGFSISAQMPQVGTKFGRWLNLTFMQLKLDERINPDNIA